MIRDFIRAQVVEHGRMVHSKRRTERLHRRPPRRAPLWVIGAEAALAIGGRLVEALEFPTARGVTLIAARSTHINE